MHVVPESYAILRMLHDLGSDFIRQQLYTQRVARLGSSSVLCYTATQPQVHLSEHMRMLLFVCLVHCPSETAVLP
jgi:hypothetical protein